MDPGFVHDSLKNSEMSGLELRVRDPYYGPSGDPMAPNFSIEVQNREVDAKIRALVTSVEYESTENMVDMLKIHVADPMDDSGNFPIRNSKLFMPGNEVSLYLGYGTQLRHVGRAIIRKVRPTFPSQGIPMLEVTGYTKDSMMGDSAPMALREWKHMKATKKRKAYDKEIKGHVGRMWIHAKYSDAIRDRARAYGLAEDIDDSLEEPTDFIHKSGITDYDFVVGLSNITGFMFWVDGDQYGNWTLHFKNPQTYVPSMRQDKTYTFNYGHGDYSTLIDFEPEMVLSNSVTKLMVQSKDPISGRVLEAIVEESQDDNDPETEVEPDNTRRQDDDKTTLNAVSGFSGKLDPRWGVELTGNGLRGPLRTASSVKIYTQEFSFEIVAGRRFRSEAQLASWAAEWLRQNREQFISGRGTLIGIESIRCRQTHNFSGLGVAYDGAYYFTRVRHSLSDGQGYVLDISARRIVPTIAPVSGQADLGIEEKLLGGTI